MWKFYSWHRDNLCTQYLIISLSHNQINLRKAEQQHFLSKTGNNIFASSRLRLNFQSLRAHFLFPGRAPPFCKCYLFLQCLELRNRWCHLNTRNRIFKCNHCMRYDWQVWALHSFKFSSLPFGNDIVQVSYMILAIFFVLLFENLYEGNGTTIIWIFTPSDCFSFNIRVTAIK